MAELSVDQIREMLDAINARTAQNPLQGLRHERGKPTMPSSMGATFAYKMYAAAGASVLLERDPDLLVTAARGLIAADAAFKATPGYELTAAPRKSWAAMAAAEADRTFGDGGPEPIVVMDEPTSDLPADDAMNSMLMFRPGKSFSLVPVAEVKHSAVPAADDYLNALLTFQEASAHYVDFQAHIGQQWIALRSLTDDEIDALASAFDRVLNVPGLFHGRDPSRMPAHSIALTVNAMIASLFVLWDTQGGGVAFLAGVEGKSRFSEKMIDSGAVNRFASYVLPSWPGVPEGSPITIHQFGSLVHMGRDSLESVICSGSIDDMYSFCHFGLVRLAAQHADVIVLDARASRVQGARCFARPHLTSQATATSR